MLEIVLALYNEKRNKRCLRSNAVTGFGLAQCFISLPRCAHNSNASELLFYKKNKKRFSPNARAPTCCILQSEKRGFQGGCFANKVLR